MSAEDAYLELLTDTLGSLDSPARGQFLQRYLRAITHLDLRENQCLQLWDETLVRRRQLSEALSRQVSLKTALMDVLSTAGHLHVPVLIEYEDLKKLRLNAVTDPLTGLYNRRVFDESFEKELNRARRYSLPLGLVVMDMHRFKEVNDKHGHPRGDDVLRIAAATLKKALRTSDFAFRIGGDEFALLLPQTDAPQALALSRRVETIFSESLGALQLSVNVGLDHGVANFPLDGDRAEELIRIADDRLYQLKHSKTTGSVGGATRTSGASQVPPAPQQPSGTTIPQPSPAPPGSKPIEEKPPTPISEAAPPVSSPAPKTPDAVPPPEPMQAIGGTISVMPPTPASAKSFKTPRKAERVSMTGTNAYAVLGEQGSRRARVLDLGFGGVALEIDTGEEVKDSVLAVLHVPILPPVRVHLKPVWSQRTAMGGYRIGCTFVS